MFSETCRAWREQKHGPGKWSHKSLSDDNDNDNHSITSVLHVLPLLIGEPCEADTVASTSRRWNLGSFLVQTSSPHHSLLQGPDGYMSGTGPLMFISYIPLMPHKTFGACNFLVCLIWRELGWDSGAILGCTNIHQSLAKRTENLHGH